MNTLISQQPIIIIIIVLKPINPVILILYNVSKNGKVNPVQQTHL